MFNRITRTSFVRLRNLASISLAFYSVHSLAFAQSTLRSPESNDDWNRTRPVQLQIPSNPRPPISNPVATVPAHQETANASTLSSPNPKTNTPPRDKLTGQPMVEPTARLIASDRAVSAKDRATAERALKEMALSYIRQNPEQIPQPANPLSQTNSDSQNHRSVQPAAFVGNQLNPSTDRRTSPPSGTNYSALTPATTVANASVVTSPVIGYPISVPCGTIGVNGGIVSDVRVISDVAVGVPTSQLPPRRPDGMVDLTQIVPNPPPSVDREGYDVNTRAATIQAPALGRSLSNAVPPNGAIQSGDLGWQTPPPRVGQLDHEATLPPRLAAATSNGIIDSAANTRSAIATTQVQPLRPATNSRSLDSTALEATTSGLQLPPSHPNTNDTIGNDERSINRNGNLAAPKPKLTLPTLPSTAPQAEQPQGQRLSGRPLLNDAATATVDVESSSIPFLNSESRDFTSVTNPDPRTLLAQNTTPGGLAVPPGNIPSTGSSSILPGADLTPPNIPNDPRSPSPSVLPPNGPGVGRAQDLSGQGNLSPGSPSDATNRPIPNIPNPADPANLPRYPQAPQVVTGAPFVTPGPIPRDAYEMVVPASFFAGGNACGIPANVPPAGLPSTQPQPAGSPFGFTPPTVLPGQIPGLYSQNNSGLRPLFTLGQENYNVSLGRGIIGQPVAYVNGQYFRNFLRYLSP